MTNRRCLSDKQNWKINASCSYMVALFFFNSSLDLLECSHLSLIIIPMKCFRCHHLLGTTLTTNLFHSDLNLMFSLTLKTETNRTVCQGLWIPMSLDPEDVKASQQAALTTSHTSLTHPQSSARGIFLKGKSHHATALPYINPASGSL